MHGSLPLVILFLVIGLFALNALTYYSRELMLFPDIIWVLILGLVYGGISLYQSEYLPQISLNADLILFAFVPLLIFASTQKICLYHFRRILPQATLLATLGIIISSAIVAIPLFYIVNISWFEALLFGIIISATDPLAVGALLHGNENIQNSQKLLIEGESILNDGFVVTVYGVLIVLLFSNSEFSLLQSGIEFIEHILGALILGGGMGRSGRWLLDKWHEEHFTLTVNMTIATAYGSFFLGEALGVSGILAVFTSALAFGYKPKSRGQDSYIHNQIWEYLEYVTNAVLFFMLGASFFVYFSAEYISLSLTLMLLLLLVLSRLGGLAILSPFVKIDGKKLTRKEFWLLNFSGARGAVSVALTLMLPEDFVLKPMFISFALIMIFASLVVYPLLVKKIVH